MKKPVMIMLSHNDPDNGCFMGKCHHIEFGYDADLELYSDTPITTRIEPADKRVKISRRYYPIKAYQTWVGNWCWDAVWVDWCTFKDIWHYLKGLGIFRAEGGIARYYDLWEE